jgi:phytoene dehydrogenase-like protein
MREMSTLKGSSPFDAIVIGSGIGGLACACALTLSGLQVLLDSTAQEIGSR